ncbi:MAG: hypothetical protein EBQ92_09920 [Proteobacteria bacterium]|nr:hypothetical protein [Pseudomonadota bacterium]
MTTIEPYILGSGAASKAIQKSLSIVDVLNPSWGIAKPHLLKRNQKLKDLSPKRTPFFFSKSSCSS